MFGRTSIASAVLGRAALAGTSATPARAGTATERGGRRPATRSWLGRRVARPGRAARRCSGHTGLATGTAKRHDALDAPEGRFSTT